MGEERQYFKSVRYAGKALLALGHKGFVLIVVHLKLIEALITLVFEGVPGLSVNTVVR